MSGYRPTELVIHRDLLRRNLRVLKSLNKNDFFCPMLKADGYGHGAFEVAMIAKAEGCKHIGVALFEEAISLRRQGIAAVEILVFSPLSPDAMKACLLWDLTPVICAHQDLALLQQSVTKDRPTKAHLKINVGMNRMGFSFAEIAHVEAALRKIPGLTLTGACCHLPTAEDITDSPSSTLAQLEKFLAYTNGNRFPHVHALNSEALIRMHQIQHPYLPQLGSRPGIGLYGIGHPDLSPAMGVKSKIMHTQKLSAGDAVSYGGRWVARRDSVIGIVPIGYADGVRRGLSHNLSVQVDGKSIQVVGTICMDYIMIDITDLNLTATTGNNLDVSVMDLQQPGLTVNDWAERLNTIPYEVMVGFGARLRKAYQ